MGTAGGVKTTTIAVLILSIAAYLQGKKDVEVYGRRIRESYLRSAMVVAGTSVLILYHDGAFVRSNAGSGSGRCFI